MTNYELFNIRQLIARHDNIPSLGNNLACFSTRRGDAHIPLNILMYVDYVHICLFKEGNGQLVVNGTEVALGPDDLLLCPQNSVVEFRDCSSEFHKYTLALDPRFIRGNAYLGARLENMLTLMRIHHVYKLHLKPEESRHVETALTYLQGVVRESHPAKEPLLQSLCHCLMLEIAPAFNRRKEFEQGLTRQAVIIRDFYNLAQVHFRQEHFLGFYASQLCISEQYLSLVVRETTGRTVADILSSLLIIEAEKLLIQTRRPIKFVADQLAFRDTTNFCTYFKGKTGLSPTEYRKKYS